MRRPANGTSAALLEHSNLCPLSNLISDKQTSPPSLPTSQKPALCRPRRFLSHHQAFTTPTTIHQPQLHLETPRSHTYIHTSIHAYQSMPFLSALPFVLKRYPISIFHLRHRPTYTSRSADRTGQAAEVSPKREEEK